MRTVRAFIPARPACVAHLRIVRRLVDGERRGGGGEGGKGEGKRKRKGVFSILSMSFLRFHSMPLLGFTSAMNKEGGERKEGEGGGRGKKREKKKELQEICHYPPSVFSSASEALAGHAIEAQRPLSRFANETGVGGGKEAGRKREKRRRGKKRWAPQSWLPVMMLSAQSPATRPSAPKGRKGEKRGGGRGKKGKKRTFSPIAITSSL